MVKICTKCKIEKELSEFYKDKITKDGLTYKCKSCGKQYRQANRKNDKKYRQTHKEKIKQYYQANKEKIKEYRQANKERIKERAKQYRQANKEKIKQYLQSNKERITERAKEYYQTNKEYFKEYRQTNKERIKENKKEYQRNRRKTDPLFKMCGNLRTRTLIAFKNKGYSKNTKTQEMLGVDWEVCKAHIEIQFTKGMNWDNQGEWHIDHIIPLASANNEEELMKLCHYTNLQPLWAEDNLSKNDKIIEQQIKFRI
jgi:hypothetical protein